MNRIRVFFAIVFLFVVSIAAFAHLSPPISIVEFMTRPRRRTSLTCSPKVPSV